MNGADLAPWFPNGAVDAHKGTLLYQDGTLVGISRKDLTLTNSTANTYLFVKESSDAFVGDVGDAASCCIDICNAK